MCIVGFTTRSKGWGTRSLFQEKKIIVSRNCNLLQHDDEPLDGYLGAFCHPPMLIKWYGFYPKKKTEKKIKKCWRIKKTSRMCQCTRKTIGKKNK